MLDKIKQNLIELGLEAENYINDIVSASNRIYDNKLCNLESIQNHDFEGCQKNVLSDEEKISTLNQEIEKSEQIKNDFISNIGTPNKSQKTSVNKEIKNDFNFNTSNIKLECIESFSKSMQDLTENNKKLLDDLKNDLEKIKEYWFGFYFGLYSLSFVYFYSLSLGYDVKLNEIKINSKYSKISKNIIVLYETVFENLKNTEIQKTNEYVGVDLDLKKTVNKNSIIEVVKKISQEINLTITDKLTITDRPINYKDGYLGDFFDNNREATKEELDNNSYLSNLESELSNLISNQTVQILSDIDTLRTLTIEYSRLNRVSSVDMDSILKFTNDITEKLYYLYEKQNVNYQIDSVYSKFKDAQICNNKINFPDNIDISKTQNINNINNIENTLSNGDISKIDYWMKYSMIINTIGLSPTYWSVGLYLTGAPVLLPIIWLPLVVIPTPFGIIVIFITICGLAISPVVWMLKMLPLGDSDSYFLVLFKSANQLIKQETGSKSASLGVIASPIPIDVNPELTKKSVMIKDDLPRIENVTLTNPLLLLYINKWLLTAKPYLGF